MSLDPIPLVSASKVPQLPDHMLSAMTNYAEAGSALMSNKTKLFYAGILQILFFSGFLVSYKLIADTALIEALSEAEVQASRTFANATRTAANVTEAERLFKEATEKASGERKFELNITCELAESAQNEHKKATELLEALRQQDKHRWW